MARISLVFLLLSAISFTSAQNIDTLLQKHFKAAGQDLLSNKQTMYISGKLGKEESSPSFVRINKRPGKFYLEVTVGESKIIRAYDGETGWTINPFAGINEPVKLEGEDLNQLIEQGKFDLYLYRAYNDGRSIDLSGTDTTEDVMQYVIMVEETEGNSAFQYMDSETFLITKTLGMYLTGGAYRQGTTVYKDIVYTDGIAFPRYIDISFEGESIITYYVDSLEYDRPFPDSLFQFPKP